MRRARWLALTGTPGTGKTRLARELRRAGFEVVDGGRFAKAHGCVVGFERSRRTHIVDIDRFARALAGAYPPDGHVRVLDSHWAHAVPGVAAAIVLRLHPDTLRARLARRRWPKGKIQENVEAEAMDIILSEAVALLGRGRVGELDMTRRTATSAARALLPILREPRKLTKFEIGRVNWTAALLRWF